MQKRLLTDVLENRCFKKRVNFPGKYQWRRLHKFIFVINTAELGKL